MTTAQQIDAKALPAPLSQCRVLDFTHVLAGPFCTRLLADFGAAVVRVESARRPDRLGQVAYDPAATRRQDRHPFYLNNNRNKASITLYLKHPEALALARRLAACADVVVENFSAGVMERLGLGYETLASDNPGLVFVSMSGYGNSGPRRDWTSMNMNLQAYSGMMLATGAQGDPPTMISNSWNDYIGGFHAAFGVLEALRERRASGAGRYIDLSQFECSAAGLAPSMMAAARAGAPPPRIGNRALEHAPQGVYPCAGEDAWAAIAVTTDAEWHALVDAMGNPDWAAAPALAQVAGRQARHDLLDERIAAWTRAFAAEELTRRLQAAGVPCARMRRIAELIDDGPADGGVFTRMEDPPGTPTMVTRLPIRFARSAAVVPAPAPRLGEQTDTVLRDWLGLDADQIAAYRASGALA